MDERTDAMGGDATGEFVMRGLARTARRGSRLLGLLVAASLYAVPALAQVIGNIGISQHDSTASVRLELNGPVHLIRYYSSKDGEVGIYLQALAPGTFGGASVPDEVRESPASPLVPHFTARVSLDPRCEVAANPVCIVIRFERPVRCKVRIGEDLRSLVLELPVASETKGPPASTGERR
jgi:hypothetical protein